MLPKKFRFSSGVTFIELLLVVVIISTLFIPFILTFRTTRSNQALRSSASELADTLRNAHVFAREAKDKVGWGVTNSSSTNYIVVTGKEDSYSQDSTHVLESGVTFESDFFLWFGIGTGEIESNQSIVLVGDNGKHLEVQVYKTGVVETGTIQ